jgi:hypothetical protein
MGQHLFIPPSFLHFSGRMCYRHGTVSSIDFFFFPPSHPIFSARCAYPPNSFCHVAPKAKVYCSAFLPNVFISSLRSAISEQKSLYDLCLYRRLPLVAPP